VLVKLFINLLVLALLLLVLLDTLKFLYLVEVPLVLETELQTLVQQMEAAAEEQVVSTIALRLFYLQVV
jgi:hypothetical protein